MVVDTGSYYAGVSDSDTLKAFNARCDLLWSDRLDGFTRSSPALVDVEGNGRTYVIEGTDHGSSESVWVIDGASSVPVWHTQVVGRVIGSVVTDDPNGTIGITIAGYNGDNRGIIVHYEIPGSQGSEAVGGRSWPMFHHDPQPTGVSPGLPARGSVPGCNIPRGDRSYDLAGSDGGIFSFGVPFFGSTGAIRLAQPIVGMSSTADGEGYWMVAAEGGVFSFGDATFFGSMAGRRLNGRVVAMDGFSG